MKKLFRKIVTMLLAVLMVESFLPTYAEGDDKSVVPLTDVATVSVTHTGTVSRSDTNLSFSVTYDINQDLIGTKEQPGNARNSIWRYDLNEFINQYPELTGIVGVQNGQIFDGNTVSGTYTIHDGVVDINPDQNWLSEKNTDLKGTFNLSFQYDGTKVPEGGDKNYVFPGNTSGTTVHYNDVIVTPEKTLNGFYGSKGATFTPEKLANGDYKLTYQVKVKADADMNTMVLTDTLLGSQNFDASSFKLSGGNEYNRSIPASVLTINGQNLTFDLSTYLKSIGDPFKANCDYTITYDTIIPAGSLGNTESNHAKWSYDGGREIDGHDTSIVTNKKLAVTKAVTENPTGTYHYTITVGDGSEALNGHTIKDVMSDNQVLDGAISISPALPDGTTTIPDTSISADAKDDNHSSNEVNFFTYTFPNERCQNQYTITYNTKAATSASLSGTQKITNQTTDDHGGDEGKSEKTSVDHNFGEDTRNPATITKAFDHWDESNNRAYWTLTLNIPENKLPLENVDVKEKEYHYGYGTSNYGYTPDINWNEAVVKAGNRTLEKGKDYTIVSGYDNNSSYIHFDKISKGESQITIELSTTLSNGLTSDQGDAYISNTAEVDYNKKNNPSNPAEQKYHSNNWKITKDVTAPDTNDGIYTWTVEINPNQTILDPDVQAYFKDQIPDGMEFVGSDKGPHTLHVEYAGKEGSNYDFWYGNAITYSNVTADGNGVIGPIRLTGTSDNDWGRSPAGLSGYKIKVIYQTKIKDSWRRDNNGENHDFTNIASVTGEDGNTIKSTSKTVKFVEKNIDKKDVSQTELKDDHPTIDYQVDVNPDALTLNNGDNCYLEDKIADNVDLMTGTINVLNVQTGKEISIPKGISYDDSSRTLKIYVPDKTHVKVTYSVKPVNISADGHTAETFTNTVVLHGKNTWTDSESKEHVVVNRGATLSGANNQISLRKVSAYDLKTYLSGAEFTLYQAGVDTTGKLTDNDVQVGDPKKTDSTGKVTFTKLQPESSLYYWIESKAPNGYTADQETRHYFVLYSSDNDRAKETASRNKADAFIQQIKNNNPSLNIRRINSAEEWTVTNEKDSYVPVTFKGSKKLTGRDMGSGEFTFEISGDTASYTETDADGKTTKKNVAGSLLPLPAQTTVTVPEDGKTVKNGNSYDFSFGEIKFRNPGTYSYKIKEVKGSDSSITYDKDVYEVVVKVERDANDDLQIVKGYPQYTVDTNVSSKFDKADFDNTQKVGKIEVQKTLTGNLTDTDKNQRFEFVINMTPSATASENAQNIIKNATYHCDVETFGDDPTPVKNKNLDLKFTDGVSDSFFLAKGQKITIKDVPEGTSYTVTEKTTGYNTSVDGQSGNTSDSKTVSDNNVSSTTFNNAKIDEGQLTISKKLAGNALTDTDREAKYTFTVHIDNKKYDLSNAKKSDGTPLAFTNGNAKVSVTGEGSTTITGLPLNAPYTVTEDHLKNFTSTTYAADGKELTGDDPWKDVRIHKDSAVEVTNTKNLYGGISLQKKVTGNDKFKKTWFALKITLTGTGVPADVKYPYTYGNKTGEIEFVNGVSVRQNIAGIKPDDFKEEVDNGYVTVKVDKANQNPDSPVLTITGIPQGVIYTITEADYTNTYDAVHYVNNIGTVQSVAGAYKSTDVKASDINNTNKAVITNNRDAYGQLMITKKFEGNAAEADKEHGKPVNVILHMTDTENNNVVGEHFGHIFDENGNTTITLDSSNDYTVNIEKTIPLGYHFSVTEQDAEANGYKVSENEYVYLTVKDKNGNAVKEDGSNKKEWCRFTSEGEAVSDACKNMRDDIANEKKNEISTQWHKVELVNTKYAWGGFSVTKKVTGDTNPDQEFNFKVTLSDKVNGQYGKDDDGNPINFNKGEATFSLKADQTARFYGLDDGVQYTVEETDVPDDYTVANNPVIGTVKAKTFTSEQVSQNQIYTTANDKEVFHPENTESLIYNESTGLPDENKVVITNVRKVAGLTITKSLSGYDQTDKGPFTFKVTLKTSDGNAYVNKNGLKDGNGNKVETDDNGVINNISIDLNNGNSTYTITGIPKDITYTVEETDTTSHNYTVSYIADGNTGNTDVIKETGSVVNVTNTSNARGGLKVTKTVEGNAGDKSKSWEFVLKLNNGNYQETINSLGTTSTATASDGTTRLESLEISGDNDENKGYHFWLKDGQSLVIPSDELPAGLTYLVEEKKDDNTYATVMTGESGTITKDVVPEAKFTNSRSVNYNLTLKKTVEGNAKDGTFHFVVTLHPTNTVIPDATDYGGVHFKKSTDGTLVSDSIPLKDGEAKTITGLPNGTYSVTEIDGDGYTTSVKRSAVVETPEKKTYTQDVTSKTIDGQFDKYDLSPDDTDDENIKGINKAQDQTIEFTNAKTVYGSLNVTKTVNGEDADPNARFPFVINLSGENASLLPNNGTITVGGTAKASATDATAITSLTFNKDKDGTYTSGQFWLGNNETLSINDQLPVGAHYKVIEQDQKYNGQTYQQTAGNGTTGFITPDNEDGTTVPNVSFTNTLSLRNGQLTLKKKVDGNAKKTGVFKFSLHGVYGTDKKPLVGTYGGVTFDANGNSVNAVVTVGDDYSGKTDLKGLPIGSVITIKEDDYTTDGYDAPTYSGDGLTKNDDGSVSVTITPESKDHPIVVTATNVRNLPSLKIKKSVSGLSEKNIPDITFHIEGHDAAGNEVYSDDLKYQSFNDDQKKNGYVLKNIPYGTYTVTESKADVEGYHRTTTFKVGDGDTNEVDLTKEGFNGNSNLEKEIDITNDYSYIRGGFKIIKKVNVNGKPATEYTDKTVADGTYYFDILDILGNPVGKSAEITVKNGVATSEATVDDLDAGLYYVQENLAKSTGKNKDKMKLLGLIPVPVKAGVSSADSTAATVTVTNEYTTPSAAPEIQKHVEGKNAVAREYTFKIAPSDENPDAPMPATDTVKETVAGDQTVNVPFGKITYKVPGTYKYIITEEKGDENVGITYSSQKVIATIKVTNDNGNLETTGFTYSGGDGSDGNTITNTYKASPISKRLSVTKDINLGEQYWPENGFEFEMNEDPENQKGVAMPADKTAVAKSKNEPAEFKPITFTEPGTYTFSIHEVAPEGGTKDGITYSGDTHTATVTVSDPGTGKLKVDSVVYDPDHKTHLTVKNTYTAKEVQQSLSVTKNLSNVVDQNDETHWPEGGFEFRLEASNDAAKTVLPEAVTEFANVTGVPETNKIATFGPITFTETGTYSFKISEVIPTDAVKDEDGNYVKDGITYSTGSHTAVVDVKDDHKGQLVANVTYDGHDSEPSTVTNSYGAAGTWSPTAVKTVDGKKPKKSFGFELTGENKNAKDKLTKTYTASNNTTDGNIVFDPIGFTLADAGKEFDFQMKETSKDGNGIVTDKKVHDIKVTVKDNGDGTLKITPEYDGGKVKQIVFDNHAVGDLEVSKKVTGTGDKQKEFHFTVTLSDRSVDGTYGQMTFRNGVASITLKDGQTLKAENLPDDITYNVVEKEANRSGYTTKSENANGKITEGQVKKVLFVNDRKDKSPNTGDHNHTAGWTSLMFSSLILALFTLIVRRKYSQ